MENTEIKKSALDVHVLVQINKRTEKVEKIITALGKAMLNLYALQNTQETQITYVFERMSGKMVYACEGTEDFPNVLSELTDCEDVGISLADLHNIKDDRFDK